MAHGARRDASGRGAVCAGVGASGALGADDVPSLTGSAEIVSRRTCLQLDLANVRRVGAAKVVHAIATPELQVLVVLGSSISAGGRTKWTIRRQGASEMVRVKMRREPLAASD